MIKAIKKLNRILRVLFIGFIVIYGLVKIFDIVPKNKKRARREVLTRQLASLTKSGKDRGLFYYEKCNGVCDAAENVRSPDPLRA